MPDIIPTPADPTTAEIPAFIRDNPKALAAFVHGWNKLARIPRKDYHLFDAGAAWRSGIEAAMRQIKASR
jgi:hypothetical protein